MLPSPSRLAARPVLRVERRLAAPFASIGRVETRTAALATATALAIVGVAASLVAVFHLGDLLELSSTWRTAAIVGVIAWIVLVDVVEPLGFRLRDLVGSLAGEVDTYRPVAAAWLSVARFGVFAIAAVATAVLASVSAPLAATVGLFALALVASQGESVARRRAWALGDGTPDRSPPPRHLGRDEELVHAVTGGSLPDHEGGAER